MSDLKYSTLAPEVLERKEMLTSLIRDCSQLMATATRMLEVECDIRMPEDKQNSTRYNVTRTMIKRATRVCEDLRALDLTTDKILGSAYLDSVVRGTTPRHIDDKELADKKGRLYKAARTMELDMMYKLYQEHPEVNNVITREFDGVDDVVDFAELKRDIKASPLDVNPYSDANKEDFEDE